ncbi:DsbA family protein [Candidatus Methylacidithermus pantelleriae]|uniref:Protein-disulfide isomerase n=1 Tax=Candidatus Methylacidithermus pantelleriae TaxID=2744239 RepID=A0A8J2BKX3_9BACT|nr:thioredoxin domain-containing protein [Candidatus Methylacidithermus pantelleriae]CAF0691453.1 Protein-disulfide isomerase [Candidatus Methylacidithermus pantelleriae]
MLWTLAFLALWLAHTLPLASGTGPESSRTPAASEILPSESVLQQSLLKAQPKDWVKGNPDAPLTLVEYLDFQCPACRSYAPVIQRLLSEFHGRLLVVVRHHPSNLHPWAFLASLAAEAAGKEGKFWQMHDLLFDRQSEWSSGSDPLSYFESYAASLGIPKEKFREDLNDRTLRARVLADLWSASILGAHSIPSFFLNGHRIPNPKTYDDFRTLVRAAEIQATAEQVHEHADFLVMVDGKPIDFSLPRYQSARGQEKDPKVHLHHGNGHVLHIHARGVTLSYFFQTLGIRFGPEGMVMDDGRKYPNDGGRHWRLFVNGTENHLLERYEPKDLDRILLTYGPLPPQEIQRELAMVPNDACLYSHTCPERGTPPDEECSGLLGSDCP